MLLLRPGGRGAWLASCFKTTRERVKYILHKSKCSCAELSLPCVLVLKVGFKCMYRDTDYQTGKYHFLQNLGSFSSSYTQRQWLLILFLPSMVKLLGFSPTFVIRTMTDQRHTWNLSLHGRSKTLTNVSLPLKN